MQTIEISSGIITLPESKAICPFCGRKIPIEDIEPKFEKKNDFTIKMKCKCKKYIHITQDFKGDYITTI